MNTDFSSIEGLQSLLELYTQLDSEADLFYQKTSAKCPDKCGRCCRTSSKNIEATVFEMIPAAVELWNIGKGIEYIEKLDNSGDDSNCILFNPGVTDDSGCCSMYQFRGLVCRLFGISGSYDKHSRIRFSLCSKMRRSEPDKEKQIENMIENGLHIPVFSIYHYRILSLNPLLANQLYPINTALNLALKKIGYYLDNKSNTN